MPPGSRAQIPRSGLPLNQTDRWSLIWRWLIWTCGLGRWGSMECSKLARSGACPMSKAVDDITLGDARDFLARYQPDDARRDSGMA